MQKTKYPMRSLALFCFSLFIVVTFFTLDYLYDNKYTSPAPQGANGVLALSAQVFDETPSLPLMQGWRIYPGQLLGPDKISDATPFRDISLGNANEDTQLLSSGAPFGSATYVLNLTYSDAPIRLSLLVPEVFSAYHLYLNGVLATSCGDPVDYMPFLQYRLINFTLEEDTQLVFQVSNQTHYHMGMGYSPVLGTRSSVASLALFQLCIPALLGFSFFAVSLFTLGLWVTQRRHLYFIFGTLALSFAIYMSFPLLKFIGVSSLKWLFRIRDLSFICLLVCVLGLTAELCGMRHLRSTKMFLIFCGFYFLWVLLYSFLPPGWMSALLPARTFAANIFLLAVALGILWCVLHNPPHGPLPTLLILACTIFSLGLLVDHFSAGKFEPLRFLWPIDYCAALLVCYFSVLMVKESFSLARENRRLTEHLEEEVALRTQQLEALSAERKRFLADVSHDLKAPLSAIHAYMELIRLGNLQLDQETRSYLEVIEQKSEEMARRVTTLQTFSHQELPTGPKERISVSAFLMQSYEANRPDADAAGVYFVLLPLVEPLSFFGWRDKCERVLENLIYNALSFTPAGGTITLGAAKQGNAVLITVADTGCGIPPEELTRIFEQGVSLRSSDSEMRGLGLYFARTTVRELGGELFARNRSGGGAEFCILLPLCP